MITARSSGDRCWYIFVMQQSPLDMLHLQVESKVSFLMFQRLESDALFAFFEHSADLL